MLDSDNQHDSDNPTTDTTSPAATAEGNGAERPARPPRKRATKRAAEPAASTDAPDAPEAQQDATSAPKTKKAAKPKKAAKAAAKPAKKAAAAVTAPDLAAGAAAGGDDSGSSEPAAPRKRARKAAKQTSADQLQHGGSGRRTPAMVAPAVTFVAPELSAAGTAGTPVATGPASRRRGKATKQAGQPDATDVDLTTVEDAQDGVAEPDDVREAAVEEATGARRRRRRGRRGRGGGARQGAEGDQQDEDLEPAAGDESAETDDAASEAGEGGTHRRRRRKRSTSGEAEPGPDDPPNTVVHVREPREADDGVRAVKGSTRLEAKRQRRRDGRDTNRRRAPILSEAEFLARREAVDRVMAVRQHGDRTQIAVLEDGILVEHYVTRASATSYVGNVYLGRVQNVLPSMEAAFVDIGKGRNGVLYAGEVNWDAAGLEGKSRAIEDALKPGDAVLVQVTKDPIGHKGARLTSQISLPGRFLVYVPAGGMTGISRRLPDTERHRLKAILKKVVPEDAGVIVRTAAEGASEEDLTRDVERLQAQWHSISTKAKKTSAAPTLVHGEPDLAIRVVRDVFNEDFQRLVVQGDEAWVTVSDYVNSVAPDLSERLSRHTAESDVFAELRVDEQLVKALDRKVWLPSGGSLVIDRTEAMTVVDVNTGKFVGTGGNLEQTVTRNNLEAAEEIVRQLRLRDVGGIVVIDFIDMVLESNRELVLRRLTECLGRDRTKHQVAEVTSLGLVQMTRKRVGEGLLEAFSEPCPTCNGRGVIVHADPVERSGQNGGHGGGHGSGHAHDNDDDERPKGRRRRGRGGAKAASPEPTAEERAAAEEQRKLRLAAMTAIHRATHPDDEHAAQAAAEAELAALEAQEGSLVESLDDVAEADVPDLPDLPDAELAEEFADDTFDDLLDDAEEDADDDEEPVELLADEAAEAAEAVAEAIEADVADDDAGPTEETFGSAVEPYPAYPESEDGARPAGVRRRRGASRPAGPPVLAGGTQ
ncbi:MAG TPA: Rne/Rng family ribonuclease [Jatrophihabitantaceae bacterium]